MRKIIICYFEMTKYLPLGRQRASDGEEGIQAALRAALSALHNLLTAITHPVLTARANNETRQKQHHINIVSVYIQCT